MRRGIYRRISIILAFPLLIIFLVIAALHTFRYQRQGERYVLGLAPQAERKVFWDLSREVPGTILRVGVLEGPSSDRVTMEFAYGRNDGRPLTSLREKAARLAQFAFRDPKVRELTLSGYYAPGTPFNYDRKDVTFSALVSREEGAALISQGEAALLRGRAKPLDKEPKNRWTPFPFKDDRETEKRLKGILFSLSHLRGGRSAMEWHTARSQPSHGDILMRGSGLSKRIALTFDDGPLPLYSEALIDILAAHGVKATFFLVGRRCLEYPWIVRAIAAGGHEIGNHSFHHVRLAALSGADQAREIELADRAVIEAASVRMRYLRPPGGDCNDDLIHVAESRGYRIALWTDNLCDLIHAPPWIALLANAHAHGGDIMLLHTGSRATLAALPWIIRSLKSRGFTFTTLSDIQNVPKRRSPASPRPGSM
jgi:peptidoglycan/xylan/chitin deacetylase (PgdA/CDA1 family)